MMNVIDFSKLDMAELAFADKDSDRLEIILAAVESLCGSCRGFGFDVMKQCKDGAHRDCWFPCSECGGGR